MRESRMPGSARGARSNPRPYRDHSTWAQLPCLRAVFLLRLLVRSKVVAGTDQVEDEGNPLMLSTYQRASASRCAQGDAS